MVRWLHISDLHIRKKADWNTFQKELLQKCERIGKFDFVIVTGDFHNYSEGDNFSFAKDFLRELIKKLNLDINKDLFIVPGNHDGVTNITQKDLHLAAVQKDPLNASNEWIENLERMFEDYEKFVKDLIPDYPVEHPAKVHNRVWNNKINLIHCNTAIGADGRSKVNQILNIDELASVALEADKPNIILAHNSFFDLNEKIQLRLIDILRTNSICAYLCGDKHVQAIKYIVYDEKRNKQIPCVVSYKSAPDASDDYSVFGIIIGEWEEDVATLKGWTWKSGVGFEVDSLITEIEILMGKEVGKKDYIDAKNRENQENKVEKYSKRKEIIRQQKTEFNNLYYKLTPSQIKQFNLHYNKEEWKIKEDFTNEELFNYMNRMEEENMLLEIMNFLITLF